MSLAPTKIPKTLYIPVKFKVLPDNMFLENDRKHQLKINYSNNPYKRNQSIQFSDVFVEDGESLPVDQRILDSKKYFKNQKIKSREKYNAYYKKVYKTTIGKVEINYALAIDPSANMPEVLFIHMFLFPKHEDRKYRTIQIVSEGPEGIPYITDKNYVSSGTKKYLMVAPKTYTPVYDGKNTLYTVPVVFHEGNIWLFDSHSRFGKFVYGKTKGHEHDLYYTRTDTDIAHDVWGKNPETEEMNNNRLFLYDRPTASDSRPIPYIAEKEDVNIIQKIISNGKKYVDKDVNKFLIKYHKQKQKQVWKHRFQTFLVEINKQNRMRIQFRVEWGVDYDFGKKEMAYSIKLFESNKPTTPLVKLIDAWNNKFAMKFEGF